MRLVELGVGLIPAGGGTKKWLFAAQIHIRQETPARINILQGGIL
jgi:hypothetical protein